MRDRTENRVLLGFSAVQYNVIYQQEQICFPH